MRKFLLLLTTLFTLSAAYAQDPVVSISTTKANQSTTNKTNQYTTDVTAALVNSSDDTQTWSTSGFSSNNNAWNNIRCGNKNAAATGYTANVTTDFAISAAISKVTITLARFQNGANDKITSIKLLVADDAEMTNPTEAGSITDFSEFLALSKTSSSATPTSTCTYDFTITAPVANKYYQLAFEMPKTTNNGVVGLLQIDYYGEVDADAIAAPVIALGDNNMVSISQEDNADIYYTVDGTVPSATSSTKYSAPFAITTTTTVKAIAVLNGKESPVTTKELKPNTVANIAEFLTLQNTDPTKINTPITAIYKNGSYMWFKDGDGSYLLSYGTLPEVTSVTNGDVYSFITGTYKYQYGVPEILPTSIGEKSTGTPVDPIDIESFEDLGTDMVNQYIKISNVKIEAASDPNYTATDSNDQTCTLRNVFTNATYNDVLEVPEGEGFTVYGFVSLYVTSNNTTIQINPIKIDGGTVMETVATPVFNPESASELSVGDQITIECATEGAKIYVAFDGEEPTSSSQEYTAPLTFSEPCTIKAIAIKDGMLDSDIATATYTLKIAGQSKAMFDFTTNGNVASLTESEISAASAASASNNLNGVVFKNGPVALQLKKGEATAEPRWWKESGGPNIRAYKNNEIEVSLCENGYRIESIEFTQISGSTSWASSWAVTPNDGTWTGKTWAAPENSVVNNVTMIPATASRIATVEVKYVEDPNGVAGIGEIGTDDNSNAPVEYFNLQGIRVNGDNLTPGIYIRRQGTEVVKILVK